MTTWLDRRQQKNRAEVYYWSVECWQKCAEKEMPILCLYQTQNKCGGQALSEIPWLKCSERPGSQQLSAGRFGSVEGQCIWPISSQQLSPRPDQTLAATSTCESASVLTTVTSRTRGLPLPPSSLLLLNLVVADNQCCVFVQNCQKMISTQWSWSVDRLASLPWRSL